MYADANRVTPKGIYLTTLALVILVTRPVAGRLGDRLGHRRVFLPCLLLISLGLGLLAAGGTRTSMIVSAAVFGLGLALRTPFMSVTSCVTSVRRGAGPHSAPSSPRSIPASAPVHQHGMGHSTIRIPVCVRDGRRHFALAPAVLSRG
jgi:MFS family permease